MGFDVSAHPVDVDLIQERLFPFIRGEGSIDDLVERAVKNVQITFRANSWGLGVLDVDRGSKKKKLLVPPTFDSDLHVWGRPLFITGPSDTVSASIDRYLVTTTNKQIDTIAAEMLANLESKLVGKVKRSEEGKLPTAKKLGEGLLYPLNWCRDAHQKWQAGEMIQNEDGDEFAADGALLATAPLQVLKFAAYLQPGWMDRGYVWTTAFMERAKLTTDLLESPAALMKPLLGKAKGFKKFYTPAITENYMVGGYVQPKNVPAFRKWFLKHTDTMVLACLKEEWDEASTRLSLQKIHEALADAEHRKMGFAEAAEVYSGIMGIMN